MKKMTSFDATDIISGLPVRNGCLNDPVTRYWYLFTFLNSQIGNTVISSQNGLKTDKHRSVT